MLCPFCREKDTSVVDSRPTEDGTAIRRRRVCGCERKERFTTFERVQFRELTVIKCDGHKDPFVRDKITKSINISFWFHVCNINWFSSNCRLRNHRS